MEGNIGDASLSWDQVCLIFMAEENRYVSALTFLFQCMSLLDVEFWILLWSCVRDFVCSSSKILFQF